LLHESGGLSLDVVEKLLLLLEVLLKLDFEDPLELRLMLEDSLIFFCLSLTPAIFSLFFSSGEITGAFLLVDSLINVPCLDRDFGLSVVSFGSFVTLVLVFDLEGILEGE
jgi:hypothetical protein